MSPNVICRALLILLVPLVAAAVGCDRNDGKTGFSATHEALVLKGTEVCSAVELTYHGPGPVRLREVLLNGEHPAVPAEKASQRYAPSGKPLPDSLSPGDTLLLFHRDMENRPPENYAKDLSHLLIRTDTGEFSATIGTPTP